MEPEFSLGKHISVGLLAIWSSKAPSCQEGRAHVLTCPELPGSLRKALGLFLLAGPCLPASFLQQKAKLFLSTYTPEEE